METLLPDTLKMLWGDVERGKMSADEFQREQERLVGGYRHTWTQALLMQGFHDLAESLVSEISGYTGNRDLEDIRRRCLRAVAHIKAEWHRQVKDVTRESVERFYADSDAMIYELMWWHTLGEDSSPLAYVLALEFARSNGCRDFLDFGSGVGSGGILFARHGFHVTLGDISPVSLGFSRWRFDRRGLRAVHMDLREVVLPEGAFDFITAMDVFEHLIDPREAVGTLYRALKPGGFLFGRFHAEHDEDRPQHVTLDFDPTFETLAAHGFVEVWRDEWLWGHQVFRKA